MQMVGRTFFRPFAPPIIPEQYLEAVGLEQQLKWLFSNMAMLANYEGELSKRLDELKGSVDELLADLPAEVKAQVVAEIKRMIEAGEFQQEIEAAIDELIAERSADIDKGLRPAIPYFVAHRGLANSAPENSKWAYMNAGKWGYRAFETDIQRTADGVFVCCHDRSIVKQTGYDLNIDETGSADILDKPVISGSNVDRFPTCHILTLDEYLALCSSYDALPVIEIKAQTMTADDLPDLAHQISGAGYSRCAIISGSANLLAAMREHMPHATMLLVGTNITQNTAAWCLAHDIDGVDARAPELNADRMVQFHRLGLIYGSWYTTEPGKADEARMKGVDFLTVDDICELNRPASTVYACDALGFDAELFGGVQLGNQHELESAIAGRFTSFIWRNPLDRDSFGNYAMVARNTNNRRQLGTIPRSVPNSTIIRFKRNDIYKFSIQSALTVDGASFADSGWIEPTSADVEICVASAGGKSQYIALTCARIDGEQANEYMFDDAWKFVEIIERSKLSAVNTSTNPPALWSPSTSRVNSGLLLGSWSGKTVEIDQSTGVQVAFQMRNTETNDILADSGWLAVDSYTLPTVEDSNALLMVFKSRNPSSNRFINVSGIFDTVKGVNFY